MKKLYYTIAFILVPLGILSCEYWYFEVADLPFISAYICTIIALAVVSVMMGNLSPSHKKFDYMIPIIMVLLIKNISPHRKEFLRNSAECGVLCHMVQGTVPCVPRSSISWSKRKRRKKIYAFYHSLCEELAARGY